jgi:hypothetical protein
LELLHAHQALENTVFQGREARFAVLARMWQLDHLVEGDTPFLDQQDAIGQRHRLGDIVRHQHRGERVLAPDLLDQALHLDTRQGIQGTQGFVEQQQARAMDQRTRQRDALPLAPGKTARPLVGAVGKANLRQRLLGARSDLRPLPGSPRATFWITVRQGSKRAS